VAAMLQAIVSFVHVRAVNGSMANFLIYPVLFMCIVLSTFYMFFFSLITIFYPLLVYAFTRYGVMHAKRSG
jgi:hypothetical protein